MTTENRREAVDGFFQVVNMKAGRETETRWVNYLEPTGSGAKRIVTP